MPSEPHNLPAPAPRAQATPPPRSRPERGPGAKRPTRTAEAHSAWRTPRSQREVVEGGAAGRRHFEAEGERRKRSAGQDRGRRAVGAGGRRSVVDEESVSG